MFNISTAKSISYSSISSLPWHEAAAAFVMNNSERLIASSVFFGGDHPLIRAGAKLTRAQEVSDRSWYASAAAIELIREIESFSSLPEDWDGEGALEIAPAAVRTAIQFIQRLTPSTSLPVAYPNPNGTLTLFWRWRDGRAELEIGRTRHSWVVVDRSGSTPKRTSCSGDNQQVPLLGMCDLLAAIGNNCELYTLATVGLAMSHEWVKAA